MAALLRQGSRRLSGSMLRRTQAAVTSPAVAEERPRLVPRRMYSAGEHSVEEITREIQQKQQELADAVAKGRRCLMASNNWRDPHGRPSTLEVQQKKEALYEVLCKADNLRNKGLLKDLAVHVEPKPWDSQWRRLRSLRKMNYFAEAAGTYFFFSFVVWVMDVRASHAAAEKQVKMEREDQVETLME